MPPEDELYLSVLEGQDKILKGKLVHQIDELTRWRQRMGEGKLLALLQESLPVAARTDAVKPSDLARAVIDRTVQPKAVNPVSVLPRKLWLEYWRAFCGRIKGFD